MLSATECFIWNKIKKIDNEIIIHETVVNSCRESGNTSPMTSMQHPCTLGLNNRCAYCELSYDNLKKLFLYTNEISEDARIILHEAIDECISRLGD
jgi:hypothetical protein